MQMINEPGPEMEPCEIEEFSKFIANRDYLSKERITSDDLLVVSGSAPRGFDK